MSRTPYRLILAPPLAVNPESGRTTEIMFMKTTLTAPSHEKISARAQQLWQIAGNPADRDLEFWLAGENEIEHERVETSRAADALPQVQVSATSGPEEIANAQLPVARRRRSR
jgi:hypothetical protein